MPSPLGGGERAENNHGDAFFYSYIPPNRHKKSLHMSRPRHRHAPTPAEREYNWDRDDNVVIIQCIPRDMSEPEVARILRSAGVDVVSLSFWRPAFSSFRNGTVRTPWSAFVNCRNRRNAQVALKLNGTPHDGFVGGRICVIPRRGSTATQGSGSSAVTLPPRSPPAVSRCAPLLPGTTVRSTGVGIRAPREPLMVVTSARDADADPDADPGDVSDASSVSMDGSTPPRSPLRHGRLSPTLMKDSVILSDANAVSPRLPLPILDESRLSLHERLGTPWSSCYLGFGPASSTTSSGGGVGARVCVCTGEGSDDVPLLGTSWWCSTLTS